MDKGLLKRFFHLIPSVLLFWGCGGNGAFQKNNAIVFSCILCKGCVQDNMAYILANQLDSKYDVFLDTTCYAFQNGQLKNLIRPLKYNHMDAVEMEKRFGVFGNFTLFDSTGNRVDFKTDMHLRDYIR